MENLSRCVARWVTSGAGPAGCVPPRSTCRRRRRWRRRSWGPSWLRCLPRPPTTHCPVRRGITTMTTMNIRFENLSFVHFIRLHGCANSFFSFSVNIHHEFMITFDWLEELGGQHRIWPRKTDIDLSPCILLDRLFPQSFFDQNISGVWITFTQSQGDLFRTKHNVWSTDNVVWIMGQVKSFISFTPY